MAAKAPTRLRPTSQKTWVIAEFDEPVLQDPLTFFEKNEFLGLVARAIDLALMQGMDLPAIFQLFSLDAKDLEALRDGKKQIGDVNLPDLESIVSALTRVLSLAPEVLEEAYLIILSIPREKWVQGRIGLRQIDDDTGFGILECFVEQNGKTLIDFLPRWRKQLESAMALMNKDEKKKTSSVASQASDS